MATAKTARLVEAQALGPATRPLTLEPAEPLGFVGGQYVIVDPGVVLDGGKRAKRAYSILSADARQERLVVAVRKIGPASTWLHARRVGDEVPFSGPWGKWLADDARPRRTLVLATDTGITAALGLMRGQAFAPQLAQARLVWLVEDDAYFLPDAFVRAALPAGVTYRVEPLPPVGHGERLAVAAAAARAAVAQAGGFDSVFLAGDGAVLYPLAAEGALADARIECFFNNPAKKSQ